MKQTAEQSILHWRESISTIVTLLRTNVAPEAGTTWTYRDRVEAQFTSTLSLQISRQTGSPRMWHIGPYTVHALDGSYVHWFMFIARVVASTE